VILGRYFLGKLPCPFYSSSLYTINEALQKAIGIKRLFIKKIPQFIRGDRISARSLELALGAVTHREVLGVMHGADEK
jgi:hypothetical protein